MPIANRSTLPGAAGARLPKANLIAGIAMVAAALLSIVATPRTHEVPEDAVNLARMVPTEFGRWKEMKTGIVQMDLAPREGEERTTDQPYDQVLMRSYERDDGAIVMLALAYGRSQRQEVKIHRPELCYVAQGFEVVNREKTKVVLAPETTVSAYRLMTRTRGRVEPVTYWIRIGNIIAETAWQSRWKIFTDGLTGIVPDGLLVRASSALPIDADLGPAYRMQNEFLADLFAAVKPDDRRSLAGGARP